jgi:hypothetical protein
MSIEPGLAATGAATGRLIAMRLVRAVTGIAIALLAVPAISAIDRVVVAPSEPRDSTPRAKGSTAPVSASKAGPAAAPDISDAVIRQAVKDSIDPHDDATPISQGAFGGGPTDRQARIDRAFDRAQIPTCMTMEAWKIDPPMIGPISLAGTILAAPFLVRNIMTGKCRH